MLETLASNSVVCCDIFTVKYYMYNTLYKLFHKKVPSSHAGQGNFPAGQVSHLPNNMSNKKYIYFNTWHRARKNSELLVQRASSNLRFFSLVSFTIQGPSNRLKFPAPGDPSLNNTFSRWMANKIYQYLITFLK